MGATATAPRCEPNYAGAMHRAGAPEGVAAVALLGDPVRARLYRLVRRSPRPVTRDEAAEQAGISRKLAAFHLDKLVDGGLLRAGYAAPPGRPRRRGRSPKVYEPTEVEVQVTIPERRYDMLGGILIEAAAREGRPPLQAVLDAARATGRELGEQVRRERRLGRLSPERALAAAADALDALGFEPRAAGDGRVTLANCLFRALAERRPELVCGINHALIEGLVEGLGGRGVSAALAPTPGACCVELRRTG